MRRKKNAPSSKQEEDRISNLPDCLIHEILSFIDVKYAVQTSVLSKRWKNIWMSLPFISSDFTSFFRDGDRKSPPFCPKTLYRVHCHFAKCMNRVFQFHDDSDIQMINLGFVIGDSSFVRALNRWILAAVNSNVQHLDVNTPYYHDDYAYAIPHQLLNCISLKSLSITLGDLPYTPYVRSILPKSMSLSWLKKLSLKGISISNLELQRLFSSCPHLEMVIIQDCDIQMNNRRNINIDSQKLQFFELIDRFHKRLGSATNSLNCSTKICVPNVKDFRCTGFMREDFSLENLSSLEGAHLKMRLRGEEADETAETYSELLSEEKEMFAKRMMRYLRAVHNAHHLTLSSGFLEVLLQAPGTVHHQAPQLCNLETMKLEMRFTRGCLRSISYLLKISPIIVTLILISKESNLADVGDDWEAEMCMFSHLESVEIREVEGCDNELKFLSFLLKNSIVLDKLILFFRSTSDSLDGERQIRKFKRNLSKLLTASSSIQVHFC